jgi:hypothetical protein
MYHVPILISVFCGRSCLPEESIVLLQSVITGFFYGEGLLAPRPTPKLEDHLLFAAAYSISSQLPSIAGIHPFHPQTEDVACHGGK